MSNGTSDRNVPINKTLHIKPLTGQLQRDEIVSHFSGFGDVRSIRISSTPKHSYFVKFAQAESVTRALEIGFHSIAGHRVEIAAADDDSPQDESTFLDLNDDCIHEILSTECLSEMDLCSVAETHPKLKEIAGRAFGRKNKGSLQGEPVQRIIKNFGWMVSDWQICGYHLKDKGVSILDSVTRYCSRTLESLNLRGCVIPDNVTAKPRPSLDNLQKLKIEFCTFEGASKEWFADCGSVVELKLNGRDVGFIVENTFPKLQKFKCDHAADGTNFYSFILRHKNLASIAIRSYKKWSSLLPIIGANCKRLVELEFCIYGDETFDLSSLGHVRKLNIYCFERDVMEAVRGWNNLQFLENLTLQCAIVDAEFFQTLSQLRRLQVLTLRQCDGLENFHQIGDSHQLTELEIDSIFKTVNLDFVALIQRLCNLKALSVNGSEFKMDLETYLRIVDVVRARPDKSKLIFQLNNNRPQQHNDDMRHSFSLNGHIVEMITGK